jgi:hypothetical protein
MSGKEKVEKQKGKAFATELSKKRRKSEALRTSHI